MLQFYSILLFLAVRSSSKIRAWSLFSCSETLTPFSLSFLASEQEVPNRQQIFFEKWKIIHWHLLHFTHNLDSLLLLGKRVEEETQHTEELCVCVCSRLLMKLKALAAMQVSSNFCVCACVHINKSLVVHHGPLLLSFATEQWSTATASARFWAA